VDKELDAPGRRVVVNVVVTSGAGIPLITVLMPTPGAPLLVDTYLEAPGGRVLFTVVVRSGAGIP
jgi:hypothetical protein